MRGLTPSEQDTPAVQAVVAQPAETVMPCPFCGSDKATGMEIDMGAWAVCCSWCGTIGPRSRGMRLAVARWNSPLERQRH